MGTLDIETHHHFVRCYRLLVYHLREVFRVPHMGPSGPTLYLSPTLQVPQEAL